MAERQHRDGTFSPTEAAADLYAQHRDDLDELRAAFQLEPGQAGACLALGDSLCLDFVSRPDAFSHLYPKLLDGYLLDALDWRGTESAARERVESFLAEVNAAGVRRSPSVARGDDIRLSGRGCVGSGLELDGELLQLSAYTRPRRGPGRIARPSVRR